MVRYLLYTSLGCVLYVLISSWTIYTSDSDGIWNLADNWDIAAIPNHNTMTTWDRVIINSDIVLTGDLVVVSNSELIVKSNKTLTVNGNVVFTNGSSVHIETNGELIVNGDVANNNNSNDIIIDGTITINGNYWGGNGSELNGTGAMDITGSVTTDGTGTVFGSMVDCVSGCSSSAGSALPVELVEFSFNRVSSSEIELYWLTATEVNSDYFEILRSENGVSYSSIGQVAASGNSVSEKEYSFIDYPSARLSYYKLKQVDLNGEREEFGPLVIQSEGSDDECKLKVFPNPCYGDCRIQLSACEKGVYEDIEVQIYDAAGNLVHRSIPVKNFNGSFDHSINATQPLQPGVYIVRSQIGDEQKSEKLIVN